MERSSDGSPYEAYLRRLEDEISDLDTGQRQEILREMSAHLEDADEALSATTADPDSRARRVLWEYGATGPLARQLGSVHAGPTGVLQRLLVPCLLALLAAGHFATALALRAVYTHESATQAGLFDSLYTHLYLALAGLAFLFAVRQLIHVVRYPFRATDFQLFLSIFPLALLLAMVLAGFSDEGQPVAYRLKQIWYADFLQGSSAALSYGTPKFFVAGLALSGLALLGIVPALLLRQPRWLLLWAAIHGALLAAGLMVPLLLGGLWAWPDNAGLLPILLLPWVYASAAWLLNLPLRVLGERALLLWTAAAAVGGALSMVPATGIARALVGVDALFPLMLLLPYAWYWPAALLLPISAVRLWRYAESSPRVSDPLAALVLPPVALLLSLLTVQTDWGTPQLWSGRIATWDNGQLLWGAGQWLFVAALVVWTLLLAAVTSDRVIGRRPRLQRS